MDISERPVITRTRGLSRVSAPQRNPRDPSIEMPSLSNVMLAGKPLAGLSLRALTKLGAALGAPGVNHENGIEANRRALLTFLLATYDAAGRKAIDGLINGEKS
jgi:hypothetical protein